MEIIKEKQILSNAWKTVNYGFLFYGIIRGLRPDVCVELGTYAGFSAYWFGLALKHNGKGHLDCYDLWEQYLFNHVEKVVAEKNLEGLPVRLYQEDAVNAYKKYGANSVDFLMIDLSNTGDIYRDYLYNWYHKLSPNAIVLMEGGTIERDNVEWMKKFEKPSIQRAFDEDLVKNSYLLSHYDYVVISLFPGLTMFTKKKIRDD